MKSEELFAYAMTGDKTAYMEWSMLRYMPIARFGYQNGIALIHLQEFQKDVFRKFYRQLPTAFHNEQEAMCALYKIATVRLANFLNCEQSIAAHEQVLKFEEDKEMHQSILQLSENLRFPFTLHRFHQKTMQELACLLALGELVLEAAIEEAYEQLEANLQLQNRSLLEKRLEFLQKSYDRYTFSFDETKLFAVGELFEEIIEPDPLELKAIESKMPMKKGALVTIGVATVFLLSIVGTTFTATENETETVAAVAKDGAIDTRTVKAWKAEYEKIKNSSPSQLGLEPAVYEELEYVRQADEKIERLLRKRTIKKYENDPQLLRERVEKVMLDIRTPKGMYDALVNGDVATGESMEFLQSFGSKTKELMVLADTVLQKYEDDLSGAYQQGVFSAETIRAHKDQYPEEVGTLVDSLDESMLLISPHPKEAKFLARRNMELLYNNELLLQDMFGHQYIALLENEPYFDGFELLLPLDTLSFQLAQIERFLVDTALDSDEVYGEFEFIYQHAFWLLVKGSETNPVFDESGIVHQEYQKAWENLTVNTANPMIYLMLPIIEEMEASGWKKSAHYDALAYSAIVQALQMEKNGELAGKLPNGHISIDASFVDMQDFSYDQTKELYGEFALTHNVDRLKDVPPLDVLFLYYYANKRKDAETMWHLLAEDKYKPSLEDYVKQWKQQPDLTEEALWVEIYEESVYRIKEKLYVDPHIHYREQDAMNPQAPVLSTERDNIWLIRNQMYEAYSLEGNTGAYEEKVATLYQVFSVGHNMAVLESATPGEIAGLFLTASEQGDFKSMHALMEESSKTYAVDTFRQQVADREIPAFSKLKRLAFALDMYDHEDGQKRGWVRLDDGSSTEESFQQFEFAVVETEEGWRMGNINMY